jgi:hypothetical protein
VLSCLLVASVTWLGAAWLQTYRAFTQETIVAEVIISEVKHDDKGNHYIEFWYMPNSSPNVLQEWLGLGGDNNDIPLSTTLPGDAFRVQADYFKWDDLGTWFGLKPMFKLTRIAGDYQDIDDYNNKEHHAEDLNGGTDDTWQYLKDHADSYNWVGTTYTSGVGQNATNETRTFEVIATEDGLILRSK